MEKLLYLQKKLKELQKIKIDDSDYYIPSLWLTEKNNRKNINLSPIDYHINQIENILNLSRKGNKDNKPYSSNHSIIYNIFVRLTTAYDHNGDGKIEVAKSINSFKETGTFLKTISLLPYLYSLGINTIYLLPILSIGKDRRKGQLGSPYAVRNPFKLDDTLSEDILDIDVESQFKALVEAAHLLNMKVILEFVFRTASVDSHLALENPDWFYWIKNDIEVRPEGSKDELMYGPPFFSTSQLSRIQKKIEENDFNDLPVPSDTYKKMFCDIPSKVELVDEKIIGTTKEGVVCKIPGAFADWPPDDSQPVWSDVSYLRLYNHPDFNYIAYNTVRMYDEALSKSENAIVQLWDKICSIIPYYQREFGIDGVMIDMGHALPEELRKRILVKAKEINPEFIFWEENFVISNKSSKDGYDAVVGYLPFDEHVPSKLKELLKMLSDKGTPIPFFATPETHNTPRASIRKGGVAFSKFCWAVNCFIPALPFILSGFELGERQPINTGLGFSPSVLKDYTPDTLPLFSISSLSWDSDEEWTVLLSKIIRLRKELLPIDDNFNPENMIFIDSGNDNVIAFARKTKFKKKLAIFIGNLNSETEISCELKIPLTHKKLICYISNRFFIIKNNSVKINLKPMEFILGVLQ